MARTRGAVRFAAGVAGLGMALSGVGCAYIPIFDPLAPTAIDHPATNPQKPPARRVVLISIDGLAPWVLEEEAAPTLRRLAAEGASAPEAVTIAPPITLPSHASMLSGVVPERHGVTWNTYQPWGRLDAPTLFTRCAESGLRCDLFVGKRKFALFAENEPGVRRYRYQPLAAEVLAAALAALENDDPDLVVIHLAELDRAGHTRGWGSDAQRAALGEVDALLGDFVVAAVAASPRPLTLLVTADHGGHGRGHLANRRENRRIPWILWGDGVDVDARPRWVTTMDTAPTAAWLLGIDPAPGWVGNARAVGGAN